MGWYSTPKVIVTLKDDFAVSIQELAENAEEDYIEFPHDVTECMKDMSDIEKVLFMRMFRKDVAEKGAHWDLWCGHGNLQVKVEGNTATFTSYLKRGTLTDLGLMVDMIQFALKGQVSEDGRGHTGRV